MRRHVGWIAMLVLLCGCGSGAGDGGSAGTNVPGQLTYQRYCFSCHASGVSGAPPFRNAAAWAPRLAQGEPILLQHTIEGLSAKGMPPRGMCMECTDRELLDAIHYMSAAQ